MQAGTMNGVLNGLSMARDHRSRMLLLTVCFAISTLFSALLFLEPAPPKNPKNPPLFTVNATITRIVLIGIITLQILLFIGVLAFHFSNNQTCSSPFIVLSSVILIIWFLSWVAAVVYTVYTNGRATKGNNTRMTSVLCTTLLFLGNMIYFAVGVAMDRRARDVAQEGAIMDFSNPGNAPMIRSNMQYPGSVPVFG